jgi:hypothetical protein
MTSSVTLITYPLIIGEQLIRACIADQGMHRHSLRSVAGTCLGALSHPAMVLSVLMPRYTFAVQYMFILLLA